LAINLPERICEHRFHLKSREWGAIIQSMAAARLAAVLLVVLATPLSAQNASTGDVVITVIDQAGARIPGAHIGIIQLPNVVPNDDWLPLALHASEHVSTDANASGEATAGLTKGRYAVLITASGFQCHLERIEVRDGSSQSLMATLISDQRGDIRGDCMSCIPEIPLEPASLNIFIPLEPLQLIPLTTARTGRR